MDDTVVKGSVYILEFGFLIQIWAEVIFLNHVHVDVFKELRCGSIVRLLSSCIHGVILVEISRFVNGFIED